MGWNPEEAIGKAVGLEKYSWTSLSSDAEVIGVIEDHRYSPLYLQSSMSDVNRGTYSPTEIISARKTNRKKCPFG